MGIFDKFKKETPLVKEAKAVSARIDALNQQLAPLQNYKMQEQYRATFEYLWGDYWNENIPPSGAASVLQAELLRRIEKIQHEMRDNGNINWDESFDYFCDFLAAKFGEFDCLADYLPNAKLILELFKNMGQYAQLIQEDDFPDTLFDPMNIAYVDNDFYAYLFEMVCVIYQHFPENIAFEPEEDLYR